MLQSVQSPLDVALHTFKLTGLTLRFRYLVLQIAAVFVRLPDLLLQLPASLILTGQLLRQQLVALPGFGQVLQRCRRFHLHGLGDILSGEMFFILFFCTTIQRQYGD